MLTHSTKLVVDLAVNQSKNLEANAVHTILVVFIGIICRSLS